jgi:hypothetical protein
MIGVETVGWRRFKGRGERENEDGEEALTGTREPGIRCC